MYTENSNVLTKTGFTADQLESAVKNIKENAGFTPDFYQAVVATESQWGINALFMVAHSAVESGWGLDQIKPNNVTGFNANDANPSGDASEYTTQGVCIIETYTFVHYIYLTPVNGKEYDGVPIGRDYRGTTIHDVFENYSTSDTAAHEAAGTAEDETISGIMNRLSSHIPFESTTDAGKTTSPVPISGSSAATYHVVAGNTLGAIKNAYPGTTVAQWVNINVSKYPNITADFIEAGWNLVIPTEDDSTQAGVYVTIVAGNTISGFMEKYGTSRAQLKAWNIGKYPSWDSNNSGFIEAGWTGVRVQ